MERYSDLTDLLAPRCLSRVLMSGAHGLIGRELSLALRSAGVEVTTLARTRGIPNSIFWNPRADEISVDALNGFDAVVHLAGEPVGNGLWTRRKKRMIYESRVHGTEVLARALALAKQPPRVFLCASGVNYYPSSGGSLLDEKAPAGTGFLSTVCVGWEEAASLLTSVSRIASMRIGVVLSDKGGTLPNLLPAFRWGLGGYAGSGEAYLSWISLRDTIRAMFHILGSDRLKGPVNVVSPEPVTGKRFAEALGQRLGRPARLRVPSNLLRLVLGDFAEETILSSIRAEPSKLVATGFQFEDSTIERALATCLDF